MEQIRPFGRIGDVVAIGIAVFAEIVRHFDVECAIVIGEAFERDAEVLADDAARPLATDDVAAFDGFLFTSGIDHTRLHTVGVLFERHELGRQPKIDIGMRLRHLHRLFDDFDALALQHVGKARVILEITVIERGDQLAFMAIPIMEHRRNDAARLELLVEPDAVEHFECGWVVCSRTRHLLEEIIVAESLDQTDFKVGLRQCERKT